MSRLVPDEVLLARIRQEREARERADADLLSGLGELKENVRELSAKNKALLKGQTVDSEALIKTIERVLAEPGFALAERIDRLQATVEGNGILSTAWIEETRRTIATSEYAFAEYKLEVGAKFNENLALVTTTLTAYATKTFAEAKRDEAITASTAYTNASVTSEATARAAADSAEATLRIALDAQVNNPTTGLPAAHAAIVSESSARATADTAEATARLAIDAQVNNPTTGLPAAHAAITSEASARASADSALSSSISTVSATVALKARTFTQGTAPTASAVGDLWVDTSSGNQLKRWNGSSWVNTDVAGGAIGTVSAAVTTETSARVAADGAIHAMWGVSLDINGRITGKVNLDGTNASTTFTVLADAIRFYNGSSDIAPFSVSGGVVRMTNVVVTSELDIGTNENRTHITSSGLTVGNVTINGVTNQNTIAISGTHPVSITGGVAAASVLVGASGAQAGVVDPGTLKLNGQDSWVHDGTHLKTSQNVQLNGTLDVASGLSYSGSNRISFYWDGGHVKVKVDGSDQGTIPNP